MPRADDLPAPSAAPVPTGTPARGVPARSAPLHPNVRIAAIDIGSNSIRQIIADVSPDGAIRIVDEMKAAPRLGEAIATTGHIGEAAMRNALDALVRMALLARQLGAVRAVAVATSAVRDAENRDALIAAVRETTGLDIRVLSGEEEAELAYLSALAHFDLGSGRAVVMDLGGGSLELALSADGLLDGLLSFPFGALRLTEEFLRADRDVRDMRELRRHVRRGLRASVSRRDWHGAQLIASGGTFTNLAGIVLARQGMGRTPGVHGAVITRAELEHVLDLLQRMSAAERQTVPGLSPARADIIVAGLAVGAEVMARIEARELVVSAYGIREGLLLEAARVRPVIADAGVARERSVVQLAERSHYEAAHAQQVQRLALRLFDQVAKQLQLDSTDRRVLADAALLHDIGYHINYEAHHKHSYHLIVHAELLGMTPLERAMVASVARYHRGTTPRREHRDYATLDRSVRRRIKRLAAILRVADGLDRGHAGAVEDVLVEPTGDAVILHAVPSPAAPDMRLELWGAARKAGLLAAVLGAPVEIVAA